MSDSAQAFLRAVERAVAPLRRQIRMTVGRGLLTLITDTTLLQEVQVKLLTIPTPDGGVGDELADGIEVMRQYGLTSHPHPGAECVYLSVGGVRSHGIVVAIDDRRYRLKALAEGEVALYDDLGQVVVLKRGGIAVESPFNVTVSAGQTLRLEGDVVQLHAHSQYRWDVGGYGQQLFHVGGTTWRMETWTTGAVMQPDPTHPVQPPEIAT